MKARVLLVEDESITAKTLKMNLEEELLNENTGTPGVEVDTCYTVDSAKEQIERSELPYDVAILDLRLPKNNVDNHLEVDNSLCALLTRPVGGTLVVHISGFKDPAIRDHMRLEHSPRDLLIEKAGDWQIVVVDKVRRFIYNRYVEDAIHYRFSPRSASKALDTGSGGTTSQLIHLCIDISRYWPHLADNTKDLVRKRFHVDETKNPVAVFLR
jgi:CheY-like chemotaxis protein